MKIVTIVGARPQFIKAAVVSRALRTHPHCREILVHTGQHYDENMSEVFFSELDIPKPHINLGIGSGSHGEQTGRQLAGIESILLKEKPDWVLVYGDTNSTLAGALASAKLNIPVAHVEAGLRSFNRTIPEEINRILTDHCSTLLFAPSAAAVTYLSREGISNEKIVRTGDVMYDAALFYGNLAKERSAILRTLELTAGKYILATIHRGSNTDSPEILKSIVLSLREVSEKIPVVFPVHPRTRAALGRIGVSLDASSKRGHLHLIDPVGYLDMVVLEKNAAVIATDSGGVQKEAYFHQVPCVTLRTETEWVELIEEGWNVLAPSKDPDVLSQSILGRIGCKGGRKALYGDGKSAGAIVESLIGFRNSNNTCAG